MIGQPGAESRARPAGVRRCGRVNAARFKRLMRNVDPERQAVRARWRAIARGGRVRPYVPRPSMVAREGQKQEEVNCIMDAWQQALVPAAAPRFRQRAGAPQSESAPTLVARDEHKRPKRRRGMLVGDEPEHIEVRGEGWREDADAVARRVKKRR